jgi:hypothetical protein
MRNCLAQNLHAVPKKDKLTAVRGFGRKAVYLEGHNFRLFVTVVAIKLLLGNFGYKAV